ncbi:MAG TPA: type I 3-dehydroquinate dehydratase [Phycisphaerae bacterium]|nr:type I 3-dehydroquinate dehydratase [Phycisphaerae bacterium]
MTRLVVPVFGDSILDIRNDFDAAIRAGADVVELRLDMISEVSDDELRTLVKDLPESVAILLTYRSIEEGGESPATDAERLQRLSALGPMATYIDIELATWDRVESNRQVGRGALRRADAVSQSGGIEVIEGASPRHLVLSKHDLKDRPPGLLSDLLKMSQVEECAVAKLAWRCRSVRDNFEAFELMRSGPLPTVAICMGEDGLLSRILAPKFGGFATYASLRTGLETAPGQIVVRELLDRYRWRAINNATRVFGVVGDPVRHSLGPDVHNAAFAEAGIDAVYVPFRVNPGYESFKAFMLEVVARPWLDLHGLSITAPHKGNAFRFLTEQGAEIDDPGRRAKAVNTIGLAADGSLRGWNTDCAAILSSLRGVLRGGESLQGKRVLLLGAGGVARAALVALEGHGAELSIANRTHEQAASLAGEFGSGIVDWEARETFDADVVIQCTPVGQAPDVGSSLMPSDCVREETTYFDTVYNPPETKLIGDARQRGARVIDGLTLFSHQAAAQLQAWLGKSLPPLFYRGAAEQALSRRGETR